MAELKAYERGVQSQQLPVANVAAPGETLLKTLQEFSQNRAQQAQNAANFYAAKVGQQAGSQLDFQEKAPITEADKAFANAARQAHQALLHTEVQTGVLKIKEKTLDSLNPNSTKEFINQVQGMAEGLLERVSPDDHAYVKNILGYYGTTGEVEVAGAVRGLNKQIQLANTLDFLNKTSNAASEAAFKGDTISAAAIFNDTKRKIDAMVSVGVMSAAQAESHLQASRSEINVSNYLGQFQQHLKDGKGLEAYNKFLEEEHPDTTGRTQNLSYLEADHIRSRMHAMLQAHNQELALKYGSLTKQVGDFVAASTTNLDIDQVTLKERAASLSGAIREVYADRPQEQQQLLKQLEYGIVAHDTMNEAKWTGPRERADIINRIASDVQKRGVDLTADEVRNYSALASAVQDINKEITKDPAAYVMGHPAVKKAFENLQLAQEGQQSLTGDVLQTAGLPQQSTGKGNAPLNQDPYYTMIQMQKELGIPEKDISLIPKAEAAAFAASIADLGTQDAVKAVSEKLAQYRGYENFAAKDLSKAVKFDVMALRTASENPATSARMPYMYQAARHTEEELKGMITTDQYKGLTNEVKSALQSKYGAAVFNMPGDPTEAINAYTNLANKVAIVYAANGIKDPAGQAAEDIINGHINTFTVNGNAVMVPKDIDSGNARRGIESLMKTLKPENLRVPDYFMPALPEKRRKELYTDAVRLKGMAALNENQDGMYLTDENGIPVLSIEGGYTGFSFRDLNDPTKVDLHQDLTAVERAIAQYGRQPSQEASFILAR